MSNTKWYIVPGNGMTNESLVGALVQAGIEEESESMIEIDGEKIAAWEVPHRFVTMLKNHRDIFPFQYKIYVKEGGGAVRKWNLQKKKSCNTQMMTGGDLKRKKKPT